MSDEPKPADFDDELLSAYLDNELTAEERARVEERLAVDPAARQTVEQLRAVSRAVQGLPQESLGEDLRGTVLQRAERAMLAPATVQLHEPATNGDGQPARFSIGRSRRGWVWAGLAVAAALVIMVVQREDNRGNLPDVAVAPRSEDLAGGASREVPEMWALPERSAPMAADGDSAARDSVVADAPAAASPLASSAPPATAAPAAESPAAAFAADDRLTAGLEIADRSNPTTERLEDRRAGVGGVAARGRVTMDRQPVEGDRLDTLAPTSPLSGAGPEETSHLAAENEVLVVRVNVRPAALRSQDFDRLLVSNGIVIEPPAEEDQAATTSGTVAGGEFAMMGRGADRPAGVAENVDVDRNVDAVLVEAPLAQIEQCLADIDADKDTYLGVEIDEEPADQTVPVQNVAKERNWQQRYSRGRVPQQQVQFAPESNVYYDAGQNRAYGLYGRNALGAQRSLAKGGKLVEANGRAMRVETQQLDAQQAVDQLRARQLSDGRGGMGLSRGAEVREPADKAGYKPDADMLQVLFVLMAEPTPSPAAGDRIP